MTSTITHTVDLNKILTATAWSVLPNELSQLVKCRKRSQVDEIADNTSDGLLSGTMFLLHIPSNPDGLVDVDDSLSPHKHLYNVLLASDLSFWRDSKQPDNFELSLGDFVTLFKDIDFALRYTATQALADFELYQASKDNDVAMDLDMEETDMEGISSMDIDVLQDESATNDSHSVESQNMSWNEWWDQLIETPSELAPLRDSIATAHRALILALPSLESGTPDPAELEAYIQRSNEAVERAGRWRERLSDIEYRHLYPASSGPIERKRNLDPADSAGLVESGSPDLPSAKSARLRSTNLTRFRP